jgi:hypothetical protein
MNEAWLDSNEAAYEEYIESEREALRFQGADDYRQELIELIETELRWKTQDEGFVGGLQWVLDKLHGVDRI